MQILMVGQNAHVVGGSDQVLLDEATLLGLHGHKVDIFASRHGAEPEDLNHVSAVNFQNPSPRDLVRYIYNNEARRKIKSLLSKNNYDVVHCHIYYGKLSASILPTIDDLGVPLVQTLHEYKAVCPTYSLLSNGEICEACSGFKFYHAAIKRCNRNSLVRSGLSMTEAYISLLLGSISRFSRFIAVSDFLKTKVVEMGMPEDRVTRVYNFIKTAEVTPTYGRGEYFLFLGRMEGYKGVWELVKAFQRMPHRRLVMAGTGTELASLRAYCERNRVSNVALPGFVGGPALSRLIENAMCLVCPSIWYETFGLVAGDALAHGKPVVASRIGGLPEVVSEGEDGLLVTPGDVEELIEAVNVIGDNPRLREAMGRAGRSNMEMRFSPERHYDELLAVYRRASNAS